MCNACGFHCCASDEFNGCGCEFCDDPACWAACEFCGAPEHLCDCDEEDMFDG